MAHEVYISYSPPDQPAAYNVCAFLESRDIACWVADRDAPLLGREAAQKAALAASETVLVVVSHHTLDPASPQRLELQEAQARNIPIILFLIEELSNLVNISMFLKHQITIDAFDLMVEEPLEKLFNAIKTVLKGYNAFRLLILQQKLAAFIKTVIVYTLLFLRKYFFIVVILGIAALYFLGYFETAKEDKPADGLCPIPPKLIRSVTSSAAPAGPEAEFKVENLLDKRPESAWTAGVQAGKEKNWVQVTFMQPLLIAKIAIINGYGKPGAFQENGRVEKITLKFTDREVQASLVDQPEVQYVRFTPVKTASVRLVIDSAFPAGAQAPPCLSEMQVFAYCDQVK